MENHLIEYDDDCNHEDVVTKGGINLCLECGLELGRKIEYEKEWRYYGRNDNRFSNDPIRCHMRKPDEKTIFKDVEGMEFSNRVVFIANNIYQQVTGGQIYRRSSRKAIICACIFHAYKIIGNVQSCDDLIDIFKINRQRGLQGIKYVTLNSPKNSQIRTLYITANDLIEEIMNKFAATKEQMMEVEELYKRIHNKSSLLNRARPKSVASALTYYYIRLTKKNITMREFTEKTNLSELTINKLVKEIASILDTPYIN